MLSLSDRMKEYEDVYDTCIVKRIPVIIRVDGKRFSKYTKKIGCKKPFDENLSEIMAYAAQQTASNIEGCVVGYTQSDEASFVLFNDQSHQSEPWFGNRIQKMASISSSIFTAHFLSKAKSYNIDDIAYFDARVFAVPGKQEVINYLYHRQQDAIRNSIQVSAYYEVANKIGKKTTLNKLHGLNTTQQQEFMLLEAGVDWNNYPNKFKRGIAIYKETFEKEIDGEKTIRSAWKTDYNIPVFNSDKEFLNKILKRKDELLPSI